MMPPRKPPKIERLSDEFGQFRLSIACPCGHVRIADPKVLAAAAGWDAKIADLVRRLRCSKCGQRGKCAATIHIEHKRHER